MLDVVLAAVAICVVIYWYNKRHFDKWKDLGVPGPAPNYLFGNMTGAALMRTSIINNYRAIYRKCKNMRYAGIFIVRRPAILLFDPELIKEVLIRDFSNFHDNDIEIAEEMDLIFHNNPFTMKGEQWKIKRGQHIINFTPGKVKAMCSLMDDVGVKMVDYLSAQIVKGGGKHTMTTQDLAMMFTTDNVSVCALGIDGGSFDESTADILRVCKTIFNPSFKNYLNFFIMFLVPSLSSFVSARLIPPDVTAKYQSLVEKALKYRVENNIVRNDFFDNVREVKGRPATMKEMLAQVGGFFIDGFLTSSIAITFMLHELAANPHVQEKLRKEVDEVLKKRGGKLDFDTLAEMTYLDAVIAESLRKYPPLTQLSKVCTKPCTLPPATDSSKPLNVEVGTPLIIPLMALHYDEEYYPDPHRFDPERFVGANRDNLTKYTYLPFGEGPRICLGIRFANVQAKVALAKLVSAFDIKVNARTRSPIELNPRSFLVSPIGGLWIDFYKRT